MTPVLNHLWQSTLFAAAIFLLAWILRNNSATTRYWLWLTASLKFLIPFSLLVTAGSQVEWQNAPAVTSTVTEVTAQVTQPFTDFQDTSDERTSIPYIPIVWACGSIAMFALWLHRARRLRAILNAATPYADIQAPVAVRSTPTLLEPGVIGVFRPVLLLPKGLHDNLTPGQLQSILAHEMCHVRRRDNLLAMFHMAVEAIFWFHPLVWWIGARLIEERERACDEEVLRLGSSPETYAEGILNVCKFYVQSPLPCASGVTSADLKQRVLHIMTNGLAQSLTLPRKLLLAVSAAVAIAVPLLVGALSISAQSKDTATFDVASIRPSQPDANDSSFGPGPGGGIRAVNRSVLKLIADAYDVRQFQIEGGPDWIRTARFDIVAKQDQPEPVNPREMDAAQRLAYQNQARERLRNLLKDRFQLKIGRETKDLPGYVLVVARNGHKLQPSASDERKSSTNTSIGSGRGHIKSESVSLDSLASHLSTILGRKVVDQTGISGRYDFNLEWTPDDAAGLGTEASIFTAIQEQLGLKLESKKVPTEILIVHHVEKPSEN